MLIGLLPGIPFVRNQDNRQRETRKKRKNLEIKRNLIQDSAVKSRFHPVPDIGQLLISRFPGQFVLQKLLVDDILGYFLVGKGQGDKETGVAYVHLEGIPLIRHREAYVGVIHVVRYVYRFTLFHLMRSVSRAVSSTFPCTVEPIFVHGVLATVAATLQ